MSEENEEYVHPNYVEPEEPAQPPEAAASEPTEKIEGAEPSPGPAPKADPAAATEEEKVKASKGVQKRIDELTRKGKEAEERAARLAAENEQLRKTTAPVDTEPQLDDFQDYEQYVKALTVWTAKQTVAETIQQQTARQQQEAAQAAQIAAAESFERKQLEAAAKYPDFDDVIDNATTIVTAAMADAIQDSDMSGDLMYYLAKHPEEGERLAKLAPGAVFREIGKIEVKLTTPSKPAPTAAAAPIAPVSGNDTPPVNPNEMTDDQWLAYERARLRKQGRLY